MIFTDVDGTFLDAHTYDCEPQRPAVERLKAANVPIVFCTSKTRAEVLHLRKALQIHDPFIVENGGAIYVEKDYFPFPLKKGVLRHGMVAVELGTPHRILVEAMDRVEDETGCRVHRFSRMTDRMVSKVTGLALPMARLAREREYDEPFWFGPGPPARQKLFLKSIRRLPGIRVTKGNRFYHLKGVANKGRAVELLKAFYLRLWCSSTFIGLGDSANDIPMLRAVDYPIVIPRASGQVDPDVVSGLPTVLRSPLAAPHGWFAGAVMACPDLPRTGAGERRARPRVE